MKWPKSKGNEHKKIENSFAQITYYKRSWFDFEISKQFRMINMFIPCGHCSFVRSKSKIQMDVLCCRCFPLNKDKQIQNITFIHGYRIFIDYEIGYDDNGGVIWSNVACTQYPTGCIQMDVLSLSPFLSLCVSVFWPKVIE